MTKPVPRAFCEDVCEAAAPGCHWYEIAAQLSLIIEKDRQPLLLLIGKPIAAPDRHAVEIEKLIAEHGMNSCPSDRVLLSVEHVSNTRRMVLVEHRLYRRR